MASKSPPSKTWDGIVSRYLNRRLSRPIASFLAARTTVSPNTITLLSFIVALSGALGFLLGMPWLGGVLAQTSSILDGVDGDLAKRLQKVSRLGAYLDSVLDRYADAALVASMTFYASRSTGPFIALIVGLSALTGSLLVSYTRALSSSIGEPGFSSSFSNYAGNRDVRLLVVMVGSITGFVMETLVFLAVLTNLVVIARIVETKRRSESSPVDLARVP